MTGVTGKIHPEPMGGDERVDTFYMLVSLQPKQPHNEQRERKCPGNSGVGQVTG